MDPEPFFSEQKILSSITEILRDMTADWDTDFNGPIGPDTRLVHDLGFESIDIVQFIVAIEEHFLQRGLPWEEILMSNGRYVDEIKVKDTAVLLFPHLNRQ